MIIICWISLIGRVKPNQGMDPRNAPNHRDPKAAITVIKPLVETRKFSLQEAEPLVRRFGLKFAKPTKS